MKQGLILALIAAAPLAASAADIATPEEHLGFQVGADFKLARWDAIMEYFRHIGENSDRVLVETKGTTTEGNEYIMATVSSPETLASLDGHKRAQRLISHPDEIGSVDKDELIGGAKCVVLVNCSLHSTEIGASQMSMELLYELATRDDGEVREILDNTIILLVPSANPDGIGKVIDWYERSLGTPWEGMGMPWLYQKYVGHDNNRDWYMITQRETEILTRVMYHEWYPAIIYDIHQMGAGGLRFFVPPFYDPISPNVDPVIHESLKVIGGHMASALADEGKKGVITNAVYDNWWNGGARTTPYRHNIVGLLSEAASPRIASPIFQRKSELSGVTRGLPEYRPQVNHPDPWDGGWWRLRDVVEYEKIACYALFQVAARYREKFNQNYLNLGEKAVRLGREEPPFAFLIPDGQRDMPSAVRMLRILQLGGVRVHQAEEAFEADGVDYPAGVRIVYAAQPYRNYVRDMLEPQDYPDRFLYPGGPPEPPYDVAGWTLSYQMGVKTVPVRSAFEVDARLLDEIGFPGGGVEGSGANWISANQTTNDFILLNRALKHGIPASRIESGWSHPELSLKPGMLVFSPAADDEDAFAGWVGELGLNLERTNLVPPVEIAETLEKPRLGLYHPWAASMDEGWTRFVLEQFEFEYESVHNHAIRAGNLADRYDVILFPDVGSGTILNGMDESESAPEYTGGVGDLGVMHLQEFAEEGGTLLFLDSSCGFAIRYFELPVRNVVAGLKQEDFFCPGSILRIHLKPDHPLTYGMPARAAAYFARSYAFAPDGGGGDGGGLGFETGKADTIAMYDGSVTLLSGWIHGPGHIRGKGALMEVPYGDGKIVLYGFRAQHRAQTHGTFRLLFNGVYY